MEKSELSKKINEVYAELGELKTKENMILDEGKKEDSDIKDQILKLKNLSSDLEVLESDLGEFINVNKIFIKGEFVNNYNLLRQEIINFTWRLGSNHNILVTMEKIREQKIEIDEHTKRIEEHDRNMLNIMGAFLAIFSLIGVNFSFFSNFTGGRLRTWIFLIGAVNLSLITAIFVIFTCIKWLFWNKNK